MKENEKTEFFYEIFDVSLPRFGPGSHETTKRALDEILSSAKPRGRYGPEVPDLEILDIGCGNGGQTIHLAEHTCGSIVAVDTHQPALEELRRRALAAGVSERIRICLKDMRDLGPDDGTFDLIWSEGALYCMGFRQGLDACRSLLAQGGLLAVSELTWLAPDPPEECRQYLEGVYPAIVDTDANLAAMRGCGYEVLGQFALPESDWWDSLYHPLENRLELLRRTYATDAERLEQIEYIQKEIDVYRTYSRYYGYVFYLLQRI